MPISVAHIPRKRPQQCKPITVGPYTKIHIQYGTYNIEHITYIDYNIHRSIALRNQNIIKI